MELQKYIYGIALCVLCGYGCRDSKEVPSLKIKEIPTPCQSGGEPNLFVDKNGTTYLSWVEYENDSTDVLLFSTLNNGVWSSSNEISRGNNWFVNWADFPSLIAYPDGQSLAAHWLQKRAAGTYDYDIHISQSSDQGKSWSNSFIPHRDSIAAEHGFVTMIPFSKDQIFATWLDGRNTKTQTTKSSSEEHVHGGAMTLRTALFDRQGTLSAVQELDHKICDCCQTDAFVTPNGPVVVYRDRTNEEIRNISIVRKIGQDWTQPRDISEDNWKITGCPVNGPAIAGKGSTLAVAMFSAAEEVPKVFVRISKDAGAHFEDIIRLDKGDPLGRVDITFSDGLFYVSWLEKNKNGHAEMTIATINPKLNKVVDTFKVTEVSPERKSGFPILKSVNGKLILAWTEVNNEETKVKTCLIELPY